MGEYFVGCGLVLLLMTHTMRVHKAETGLQYLLVHATEQTHWVRMWFVETVIRVDERRDLELMHFLDSVLDLSSLKDRAVYVSDVVLVH